MSYLVINECDDCLHPSINTEVKCTCKCHKQESPKCVCGEQICLGGAEVEIGGVCHRPKNPCYIIDHKQEVKQEGWAEKQYRFTEKQLNLFKQNKITYSDFIYSNECFISQVIDEEVGKNYSVSEWQRIGKERGYFDYYEK